MIVLNMKEMDWWVCLRTTKFRSLYNIVEGKESKMFVLFMLNEKC